jgi:hypothetical protein
MVVCGRFNYRRPPDDAKSKAKRKKVAQQQLDLLPETSAKLFECH